MERAMLRHIMVMRIFLAMYLADLITGFGYQAVLPACVVSIAWHHLRTFDAHGPEWTCSEKFFNTVMGMGALGALLFGVGTPWLQQYLLVLLGVLFAFLAVGAITYPFIGKSPFICCREVNASRRQRCFRSDCAVRSSCPRPNTRNHRCH
jgi:hypothetical protein